MKRNYIFLTLISIMIISSCDIEKNKKYIQLKTEKDSIETSSQQKEKAINDFLKDFNEIQENLQIIKEKVNIISVTATNEKDLIPEVKDKINQDVLSIYELLLDNKKKVVSLGKN